MSNIESTSIFTGDEGSKGPSLEESYAALVEEGVIKDDESAVAQGGAGEDTQDESDDGRPAWLPNKFQSPEDMAKAYKELEQKLSKGEPKDDTEESSNEGDEEAPKQSEPTPEERKAAEEATTRAGLDLNTVSTEWFDNGGLKDETYTALEKAGYPRELVDVYIEGLVSRNGAVASEAYGVAGGEEAYGEMINWAIENLPEADQASFDREINSGDRTRVLRAIKALHVDYAAAAAVETADDSEEPEAPVVGKGNVPANVYDSMDDYLADLNDPRYDTNETFRRQVMNKLGRSKIM